MVEPEAGLDEALKILLWKGFWPLRREAELALESKAATWWAGRGEAEATI